MTVVMPAYNVNDELVALTKNAVESFGNVPLIVVDNASPVGGGYLRSIADVYVRNQKNLGYAAAVNQGLDLARTDMVAVANTDVVVSPNWQEVAQAIFAGVAGDESIGSLHFRMIDYDTPFAYGDRLSLAGKERWCTGSFFVVDNSIGHRFDEGFFNSYDDWDFQMRFRTNGFRTAYTDRSCYQHRHSSTQQFIPEREENNRRNAEHFKAKWGKYAEELFAEQFPDQMAVDYRSGFDL